MYLLPACTQFEASGSRVASNRSLQWGEQIVKPIFESKNAHPLARPGLVRDRRRDRAGVAAIGRDFLGHHKPSTSARPNSAPPAKNNTSG
jgi:hypothetical protein